MLERMVGKSLAAERGVTESSKASKVTKPKAAKATKPASDPKPKPAPTQPPKGVPEKKRKLVKETHDEPSPVKRSKGGRVRKIRKPMRSLKLVDEPSAEDIPPLPEVQVKGKEKVVGEQAAHDLLTLQTPKNKSLVKCWIRQTKTSYAADSMRKNIAKASRGKKKTTYLLIPSIRFTKLIIHHLKTKHNIHPISGSPLHYSHDESVLNIE
nr:hypothetical protein [Tanacetum cinerariifolium]